VPLWSNVPTPRARTVLILPELLVVLCAVKASSFPSSLSVRYPVVEAEPLVRNGLPPLVPLMEMELTGLL
jgi:hypothetical protein